MHVVFCFPAIGRVYTYENLFRLGEHVSLLLLLLHLLLLHGYILFEFMYALNVQPVSLFLLQLAGWSVGRFVCCCLVVCLFVCLLACSIALGIMDVDNITLPTTVDGLIELLDPHVPIMLSDTPKVNKNLQGTCLSDVVALRCTPSFLWRTRLPSVNMSATKAGRT